MERDFEQEFRELKQSEIPDLWNRIEAGLSERKIEENVSGGETVRKPFAWRKWGTLIAACLCVVIILPAFSLFVRNKSHLKSDTAMESASDEYTADLSAPDNGANEFAVAEDAAAEEPADDAAESGAAYDTAAGGAENLFDGMDESVESPSAAAGENAAESERDMNGNTADAGGTDASSAPSADAVTAEDALPADAVGAPGKESAVTTENAKTEEAERADASAEKKVVWDELENGQILEGAVVRIQKAEEGGLLYQALVVQSDADGLLERGMQIVLVCDGDTVYDFPAGLREEKALEEDAAYRADLLCDKEQGGFVVLTVGKTEE